MEKKIKEYKWRGLLGFCFVYNIVYLGRFNINYMIDEISENLMIGTGQEKILLSIIFISYAIGSFFNGPLADLLGAKKTIFIGGFVSAFMNILVYYIDSWGRLIVVWFINGYFQSMIWIGGVVLLAQWWKGKELGISIGLANFASGLSHVTAYLLPIMLVAIWPNLGWKMNFIIPMGILITFLLLFEIIAVDNPEKKGLRIEGVEAKFGSRQAWIKKGIINPWKILFSNKGFLIWCIVATLSSICRYGLLNWIPLYYQKAGESDVNMSETFINLTLPMGMAFGTLFITWIAGSKFRRNKGLVIATLAAVCATLVVIFPMVYDEQAILIGIFMTGFALYGINGILWLYAIEKGKRILSGTAAGILNAFAYIGAGAESIIFPTMLRLVSDEIIIYVTIEVFCIAMVICGIIVSRKDTNIMKN